MVVESGDANPDERGRAGGLEPPRAEGRSGEEASSCKVPAGARRRAPLVVLTAMVLFGACWDPVHNPVAFAVQCFALGLSPRTLFRLHGYDDRDELVELLSHKEMFIHSSAAVELLRRYGEEPLLQALKGSDTTARIVAAEYLHGAPPDPTTAAALLRAANDSSHYVRLRVARALGDQRRTTQITEALRKLQTDKHRLVRAAADEVLTKPATE